MSGWARPATGLVGMFLTAIGGIGILVLAVALLASALRGQPATSLAPIDPAPVPETQSAGATSSPPRSVRMIRFESQPTGAAVFEADQQLCTTPCEVEHPDYAPRVRSFALKAKNHQDVTVEVIDAKSPELVRMKPTAAGPRSPVRPTGAPDILPHR